VLSVVVCGHLGDTPTWRQNFWLGLGSVFSGGLGPWQPGTCQVGRLVRWPGGPPRQMLKEGVELRRGLRGP